MSTEGLEEVIEGMRRANGQAVSAARRALRDAEKRLEGLAKEKIIADQARNLVHQGIEDLAGPIAHAMDQLDPIVNVRTPADQVDEEPPAPPMPPEDPEPTTPAHAEDDNDDGARTNVFIVFVGWVREFTILQWLLAIIGALVGLRVGIATDDFGDAEGFARGVIQTVWVVGLILLGFGLGGLIGSFFSRGNVAEDEN